MNSAKLLMFSSLAYLDQESLSKSLFDRGCQLVDAIDDPASDTQGLVCRTDKGEIVIAFRGTTGIADWSTNFNCSLVKCSTSDAGKVHAGFQYAASQVAGRVYSALLSFPDSPVYLTGHSLGAAVATLSAMRMAWLRRSKQIARVETFGSPRVGDAAFAKEYEAAFGDRTIRHVCRRDVVARVPSLWRGYRHVGKLHYYDSFGTCVPGASLWYRLADGLASYCFTRRSRVVSDHLLDSYDCVRSL